MKKLLITGASGFLGSRIVQFYKNKYDIYAPTHNEMDITEISSVEQYFLTHKPDVVIHCAAISNVGICEKEPELSWKVNVIGTENIVKTARIFSAKCICCSSDQVYCGNKENFANDEETLLNPHNAYGKEKAYAESSCLSIDNTSVHLRLTWMYDATDNLRNDFIKQLRDCNKGYSGIAFSINDRRGITDIWEVVKNIEATFSLPGGIYNFGSPNDKSTHETVLSIFKKLHYDITCIKKTAYPNPRNITMSQEKINQYGILFSTTEEGILYALCSQEV